MLRHGISISMVHPIMKSIMHKGYDPEQFCRYVSFDHELLRDVEYRILATELERLIYAAAEYTNDEHFGLHQGQITDVVDLGVLGYVMMHSGHVAQALEAYQRYNVLISSEFNLEWESQGDQLLLRFIMVTSSGRASRHCMEDMASSIYQFIVKMSGRRIPLHDVEFAHGAPDNLEPYRAVFGVIPKFECKENVLRMNRDVLDAPIVYSDPKMLRMFEGIAEETKAKLTRGSALSDQVFQWMLSCMPSTLPSLGQTADALRLSTRTLQAKLKEENTSYNDLATSVRKELAISYLSKPDHSVADVAYLLHYSEPSAFQNAFKKWTGVSPRQYRLMERA
ncbi:transcriptional regulator [Paenibacillus swuensis]|uniref:Transcriptional regulator n=1 Tax=Paenibacillus swuensis TaxID=1178515 RepID=A0A172TMX5_9BACL|nr:AraC family transcriptional regulator [Paenibacillus swuensis]ANE48415.1 transcriptional regulator [Paenibacillus swuensis]